MGSLRQPNKQDWAALRAEHIGCDVKMISRIVNGRSSIGAKATDRGNRRCASLRRQPERADSASSWNARCASA